MASSSSQGNTQDQGGGYSRYRCIYMFNQPPYDCKDGWVWQNGDACATCLVTAPDRHIRLRFTETIKAKGRTSKRDTTSAKK